MKYTNEINFTCYFFPVETISRDELTLDVPSLVILISLNSRQNPSGNFDFVSSLLLNDIMALPWSLPLNVSQCTVSCDSCHRLN